METIDIQESIDDPFFDFGHGIFSYLKLQRLLANFLCYLSLIAIIQMTIFYNELSDDDIKLLKNEAWKKVKVE